MSKMILEQSLWVALTGPSSLNLQWTLALLACCKDTLALPTPGWPYIHVITHHRQPCTMAQMMSASQVLGADD
jgi:hypothetical protein